uniref:LAO/AO transport system ATPase n=1 Tax=uncultured Chloroflexota bacterium TaxID=166587 RepID=H5SK90_9CHLR|nr:LAO/AO transport system ATPase [uncultured bacterium]BAL56576.1 LAO/AO transport system ATPase [uncultured Chloroflexota bacterium]
MDLVAAVLAGDRLALARLLTLVENQNPQGLAALNALFPHTGRAHLIGVTGAPGTGKSSLVNRLALYYRREVQPAPRVAILAVDPSSPFSGGAVLGDRVRMRDLSGDSGIFIRSMASRGSLGGLAQSTAALAQVFDAAGYEIIFIETVGAGQNEVDIARLAHTTLVVEAPGLGDDIQAIKAGILEIADILVINKADRPGVESTEKALKNMLELAHPIRHVFRHHGRLEIVEAPANTTQYNSWVPPIHRTVATEGKGIPELVASIARHRQHLLESGDWQARERAHLEMELEELLSEALLRQFRKRIPAQLYQDMLQKVLDRSLSPWDAVHLLMERRQE